mmetsp:Transcript_18624/g.34954  ORF Transcript_18624/g.34954 Transcript_18624/m.34954 type:complete len:231 (+) Transcript_18624:57-749(+)
MTVADVAAAWIGYMVIAGACVVKLPQIYLMVKNQSADGLSEIAAALDAIAASSFSYYNLLKGYPIAGWGEQAIVAVQATLVLLLVWLYRPGIGLPVRFLLLVAWIAMSFFILHEGSKEQYHFLVVFLGSAPTGMTVISRLPQIFLNWQSRHTGQLSAITFFLQSLGSVARFLTTIQLMGSDVLSLVSHATGAILNFVVVLQIHWYIQLPRTAARPSKADIVPLDDLSKAA